MLVYTCTSLFYHENDFSALAISSSIILITEGACRAFTPKVTIGFIKREGFIVVTIAWIVISLFGCLPNQLSKAIF